MATRITTVIGIIGECAACERTIGHVAVRIGDEPALYCTYRCAAEVLELRELHLAMNEVPA